VVDLSLEGCRAVLPEGLLATGDAEEGADWEIEIRLGPRARLTCPAAVAWSQHTTRGFDVAGFRFLGDREGDGGSAEALHVFLQSRSRAGALCPQGEEYDAGTPPPALEVPLKAEARRAGTDPSAAAVPLVIESVAGETVRVCSAADAAGRRALLPFAAGDELLVKVFPPAWAGNTWRTVSFRGRVEQAGAERARLGFLECGPELAAMIRALVPRLQPASARGRIDLLDVLILLVVLALLYLLLRG
jgi:hypothetical protein